MNREMNPSRDVNEFDTLPEQDLMVLFARSAPPARPVDVELLFPRATISRPTIFHWKSPMLQRVAALALASIAAAAAITWLALFGLGSQLSFAAVVGKVAQTQSVTLKYTVIADPGRPAETVRMMALANGLGRVERPNGDYVVIDVKGAKELCVWPGEKKATLLLGMNVPSGVNPYEMFRNVINDKSTRLPDELLDGRKLHVFRAEFDVSRGGKRSHIDCPPMKVWVDPETKLPLRMEPIVADKKEGSPPAMFDIVFDKPLEPALFSFDPPAGYAFSKEGADSLPAPPEDPALRAPEVVPGIGLGAAKIGMSKEEVVKILGKPEVEKILGKPEIDYIEYTSRGYALYVVGSPGIVTGFVCFSQEENSLLKVGDFAGKTREGIGVGSSRIDLEKAFGKPDKVDGNGPQTSYRYLRMGLWFTLYGDKVVGLRVMRPHTEAAKGK